MYQSDMFDLEQHQPFLDMDLASLLTSSESDIGMRNGNEDSGNENMEAPPSGEDEGPNGQERPKRKSYIRHTQQQIQEMEAFFKECPHPDDRQRKELGRVLGLRPMQIKFWFQNKRTQAKTQREHHLNDLLRAENEKLRAENSMCKEALGNASCISCGGPASIGEMSFEEQHLRLENARLREEIQKMSGASSSNYVGNPVVSYSQNQMPSSSLDVGAAGGTSSNYGSQSGMVGQMYYGSSSGGTGSDLPRSQLAPPSANSDKQMIVELAVAAMDELTRLALMGAPLWIPCGNSEMLNVDEYMRSFPGGIGPKPYGFRTEASRDSVIVLMNPINLIEILMDVNQWSAMFSGIVPSGMTVEVLSTGLAGNYNGALQVMSAEFQIPSPLVPTRDNYFVRYCKQHQEGTWAVVDVSLDHLRPSTTSLRSRRRPSGCLIQELPNGYSKVTWVEHVEVDDSVVVMHNQYKPLITSCLAFGAKRWLASLERQCERLASSMAINIPPGDLCVIMSPEGRKSMLKLAERMIIKFCTGVGTSKAHAWIPVDPVDDDDLKVMTRKSTNEPGTPPGILLSAATSFWLPITPKRVFDFIRNENSRTEWDILSNGGEVQEMAHIANGRDPANCVSLFRVNSANCNQNNMLILQESCTDSSGSYVVYAPIDIGAINLVLSGGDPSPVPLIPSGFAILPDGPAGQNGGEPIPDIIGSGGTMLTVAFQILIDSSPSSKLSQAAVTTVSALIKRTVQRIKAAVVTPDTTT